MTAPVKVEIGDCFRMPLPDARWAYCQYVYRSGELGYVVRVFDRITAEPLNSTAELDEAGSDGKKTVKIGTLPEQMRKLELAMVWGGEGLEERIVAGTCRGDRMF